MAGLQDAYDQASETTAAAILEKLIAAPASEAKLEAVRLLLAGTLAVSGPLTAAQLTTAALATHADLVTAIAGLASIDGHVDGIEAALATLLTGIVLGAGANVIGKVGHQVGGVDLSVTNPLFSSPVFGASGKAPVSTALASGTLTGAFTPIPGRPFYLELTGAGSAVVTVVYLCNDGTTYAPNAVAVDGDAPTLMDKVTYTGGTQNGLRLELEVAQAGVTVKASPTGVSGVVNAVFVQ